jgi:hypothetical protein
MSDTPETDDLAITCYIDSVIEGVLGFRAVPIDDCRKLDRERDEARFLLKEAQSALDAIHLEVGGWIKTIKENTD